MLSLESVMKRTEIEYEKVTGVKGVHSEQIKALAAALVGEINIELQGIHDSLTGAYKLARKLDGEIAGSVRIIGGRH